LPWQVHHQSRKLNFFPPWRSHMVVKRIKSFESVGMEDDFHMCLHLDWKCILMLRFDLLLSAKINHPYLIKCIQPKILVKNMNAKRNSLNQWFILRFVKSLRVKRIIFTFVLVLKDIVCLFVSHFIGSFIHEYKNKNWL